MRHTHRVLAVLASLLVALAVSTAVGANQEAATSEPTPAISVYFSPVGGCTEAIVNEVAKAERTILVQAYSFTSIPIADALIEAHKRNVKVSIICDRGQFGRPASASGSALAKLEKVGVVLLSDGAHAIAHSKVMVIDGKVVVTGSFNFTKQAEARNSENLLVIRSPTIARKYSDEWDRHRKHSVTPPPQQR